MSSAMPAPLSTSDVVSLFEAQGLPLMHVVKAFDERDCGTSMLQRNRFDQVFGIVCPLI